MNFDDLVKSMEQEQQLVKASNQKEKLPAINEEKLKALEESIEQELSKVNLARKGCFGKLIRLIDSQICLNCPDSEECQIELMKNGKKQMIEAEAEAEAIAAENELNLEFIKLANISPNEAEVAKHPLLATIKTVADEAIEKVRGDKSEDDSKKPEKAKDSEKAKKQPQPPKKSEKPIEQPRQITENKEIPQSIAEIDISDLGKRTKVKFEFNVAKDTILTEKPSDFKRVRKICLGLVDDTYLYGSTAYSNANKIMKRLQEIGVCGWDAATKQITYYI